MTETMRERLIAAFLAETKRQGVWTYFHEWDDEAPVEIPSAHKMHIQSEVEGGGLDAYALLDAILAELREPDADTVQAVARAIGLEDSGTDIELIDEGRGSHQTYTACAKAGIAAMIDAIRVKP